MRQRATTTQMPTRTTGLVVSTMSLPSTSETASETVGLRRCSRGFLFNDSLYEFSDGAALAIDLCLPEGCYTGSITIPNYGNEATWSASQNGTVINSGSGLSGAYEAEFFFFAGSGACVIYGCTNETACNYNSAANFDDESCDFDLALVAPTQVRATTTKQPRFSMQMLAITAALVARMSLH